MTEPELRSLQSASGIILSHIVIFSFVFKMLLLLYNNKNMFSETSLLTSDINRRQSFKFWNHFFKEKNKEGAYILQPQRSWKIISPNCRMPSFTFPMYLLHASDAQVYKFRSLYSFLKCLFWLGYFEIVAIFLYNSNTKTRKMGI